MFITTTDSKRIDCPPLAVWGYPGRSTHKQRDSASSARKRLGVDADAGCLEWQVPGLWQLDHIAGRDPDQKTWHQSQAMFSLLEHSRTQEVETAGSNRLRLVKRLIYFWGNGEDSDLDRQTESSWTDWSTVLGSSYCSYTIRCSPVYSKHQKSFRLEHGQGIIDEIMQQPTPEYYCSLQFRFIRQASAWNVTLAADRVIIRAWL